jgi:transcriptional regulator with XRE-family HTH domain
MIRRFAAAAGSLLADMRTHFGISQTELAYLLGMSRPQLALAETGERYLPVAALARLRAIQKAARATPEPLPAPDLQPLRNRIAQCQAQSLRMQVRLTHYLPPLAAAARARLGAAVALPAALAAAEVEEEPLPPRTHEDQLGQLTLLLNHARAEWDERSGPAPAAILRARLAGLRAEAEALAIELTTLEAGSF